MQIGYLKRGQVGVGVEELLCGMMLSATFCLLSFQMFYSMNFSVSNPRAMRMPEPDISLSGIVPNELSGTAALMSSSITLAHTRTHTCMHLQLHKTGFSNLPPIAGRCRRCYNTPIYWNLILHIIVEVLSAEIHVEPVAPLSAAFCDECARHGRGKGVWTKVVARAREYELQPRTNIRISPTDFPFESTCSCGFAPHAGVFNCLIMHSFFKNWT